MPTARHDGRAFGYAGFMHTLGTDANAVRTSRTTRRQIARRTLAAFTIVCACATILPSCGTSPVREGLAQDAVPPDFALSIVVPTAAMARGISPAWYIVEPDGTLRAALGEPVDRSPVPPRVRMLTPGERARVWAAVRRAGWLPSPGDAAMDRDAAVVEVSAPISEGEPAEPAQPAQPAATAPLARVYLAAAGGRWNGVAPATPDEAGLADVVRTLRSLAWLEGL